MAPRLSASERLLRAVTERAWQAQVEGVARFGGWLAYHAPDNSPRRSRSGATYVQNVRRGFPDLVLVRGRRLLAVELKTETGVVSPDQVAWLTALAGAGAEVAVWRPRDRAVMEDVLLRDAPTPAWSP